MQLAEAEALRGAGELALLRSMMLVITPSSLCTMVSVAGTTVTALPFFFTLTMQSVMVCWSISGLTPS